MNEVWDDYSDSGSSSSSVADQSNSTGSTQQPADELTMGTATIPPQQYHDVVSLNAHSYLPGISQALGGADGTTGTWEETIINANDRNYKTIRNGESTIALNTTFRLVCWYTHDLVVLPGPGVTLPLRLLDDPATQPESHQRALQKLRQQIQSSCQCPGTVPVVYLGIWSDIDVDSGGGGEVNDSDTDNSSSRTDNNNEVDGMRHRLQERQWRRQSWTRFGMGPNRLRRLSERVRQELSTTDWQAIAAAAGDSSTSSEDDNDHRDSNSHEDSGTTDHPMHDDSTGDTQEINPPIQRNKKKHWSSRPGPWHGKVGTLLSIVYVHQTNNDGSSGLESSTSPLNHSIDHDDRSLILTAKAIGRFRIVDNQVDRLVLDPYAHARRRITSGHLVELCVEEWDEKPFRLPPRQSVTNYDLPRRLDPTTQVKDLMDSIHEIPSLMGMLKGENQSSLAMDPIPFSYWLATNLPSLTLGQKLKVLEMPTATERLAYLQTSLDALKDTEAVLQCANC
jgi:hypothetical protein